MIELDDEESAGVNVWIGFSDLFAGLLLLTLLGLLTVSNQLRLSYGLARATKQAAETTSSLQKKLNWLLADTQQPKTQTVIPEAVLFDPGKFDDFRRNSEKSETLLKIGRALQDAVDESASGKGGDQRKYLRIIIEGHTDSDEFNGNSGVETNWELSSRRATGVLRFFYEKGLFQEEPGSSPDAKKYDIVAMGLGDTIPVDTNTTDKGKSRNRRIVIRIEPDIEQIRADVERGRTR